MIKLTNVSLTYPVYHGSKDASLRSTLGKKLAFSQKIRSEPECVVVDALNDISFEIRNGERLGVIGRNGSGKSTLLKAIAGIYPISSGHLHVDGDVRGFFNLGAGVDFSVSGFRNVINLSYFYTRDRREIDQKLPEIIEFTELGDFIFMPVSTYSSGMIARLMVSVAVFFHCENILFDEAIGAGDEVFLRKLNKKIEELIDRSNCFMLASHSVGLMKKYCNRAIVLQNGRLQFSGSMDNAIRFYNENQ